jgi:hypothetical protein
MGQQPRDKGEGRRRLFRVIPRFCRNKRAVIAMPSVPLDTADTDEVVIWYASMWDRGVGRRSRGEEQVDKVFFLPRWADKINAAEEGSEENHWIGQEA